MLPLYAPVPIHWVHIYVLCKKNKLAVVYNDLHCESCHCGQTLVRYLHLNINKSPPKFNIAPEIWWLEDDPFLLGFGNFSEAIPVKLREGVEKRILLNSMGSKRSEGILHQIC